SSSGYLYRFSGHGGKKYHQVFPLLAFDPYFPEPVEVFVGPEHPFHHGGPLSGDFAAEDLFRLGVLFRAFFGETGEYAVFRAVSPVGIGSVYTVRSEL